MQFGTGFGWRFSAVAVAALVGGCGGSDPVIDNANQGCSIAQQKDWLRGYMRDWYYWNDRATDPDPAGYTTVAELFAAELFKGDATFPADKWSYISDTASFSQFFGDGKTLGYGLAVNGIELKALYDAGQPLTPLKVRYVDPASPASAVLARGDTIVSINGQSAAAFIAANDYSALSSTTAGQTLSLVVDQGAGPTPLVLHSALYALASVTAVQTLALANGKTAGYLSLKEFVGQAELPLKDAFTTFSSAGATELIIDLRYNGGGLISTSAVLASLVAGTAANANKTFAHLNFNSRHQASNGDFYLSQRTGNGFSRVVVLTGSRTCSASELVVNGLKPYANVVTIGGTTCGKPFGFQPRDNCGSTYSAVNFESTNALGNGRYYNGIDATCPVADDFTGTLGTPTEKLTGAAVSYLQSDACPASGAARMSPLSVPRSHSGPTTEPGEREGMFIR